MRTSGSIGGPGPAQYARMGLPAPTHSSICDMPPAIAAAWAVPLYVPRPTLCVNNSGMPVGQLDKTPAQIFDLFSTARSAPGATYYVATSGSDANNGTAPATPFATIGKAVQAANAGGVPARIMVNAGTYARTANFTNGGVQLPTVDIAFLATGGKVIVGTHDDFAFAADATHTNTFSCTTTNIDRVIDLARIDADGFHPDLTYVTTAALCNRIPGSWAYEGGKLYVKRPDGAVPGVANIRVFRFSSANLKVTSPVSIYLGRSDGWSTWELQHNGGSAAALFYSPAAKPAAMKAVIAEHCQFRYGGGRLSPFGSAARLADLHGLAIFHTCDASNHGTDGFSAASASGIGAKSHLVTVNCLGIRFGQNTGVMPAGQSCNAFTLHNDVIGIDIAGEYERGGGGLIRNIDTSLMWAVGMRAVGDTGDFINGGSTAVSAIQLNGSAKAWLDRCEVRQAPGSYQYFLDAAAALYTRAMPPPRSGLNGSGVLANW